MNRLNLCNCLAIYDWEGEIDTVQFHAAASEFFAANGVRPNVCSVTGVEGASRQVSYTIMEDRLRTEPTLAPEGFELYHTLPDYAQLVFGWDVTALLDCQFGKSMDFCCDQTLRGLDLRYFENVLDRVGRIVTLRYAIAYQRGFEFGPALYASGMGAGLGYSREEMVERDRIGAWFRERMNANRHLSGYLRDVYPLNVISQPHLAQRVESVPLAEWIGQRPARGTLRSLPGGAMLWRIDEANIEGVREELIPTGLLIAYPQAG